jgi:hypothetical protein
MSAEERAEAEELRLAPESIEELACHLAELLRPEEAQPALPRRLLTAAEVSEWWRVERRWVYDHAEQLGARRLGTGSRPRLRFDPDDVAERLGAPAPRGGDVRRLRPIDGNRQSDSLSERSRATVVAQEDKRPGGARTPPARRRRTELRRNDQPSRDPASSLGRGWAGRAARLLRRRQAQEVSGDGS